MEFRDEGILYRRVPWKPESLQWWIGKEPDIATTAAAVALTEVARRTDEKGEPISGKAGVRERGLSVTYADFPDPEIVSLTIRRNPERFRVIAFRVIEIKDLGLEIEHDPTKQLEGKDGQLIEANDAHSLILPTETCNLLKAKNRDRLIEIAWEVDLETGELVRLNRDINTSTQV